MAVNFCEKWKEELFKKAWLKWYRIICFYVQQFDEEMYRNLMLNISEF